MILHLKSQSFETLSTIKKIKEILAYFTDRIERNISKDEFSSHWGDRSVHYDSEDMENFLKRVTHFYQLLVAETIDEYKQILINAPSGAFGRTYYNLIRNMDANMFINNRRQILSTIKDKIEFVDDLIQNHCIERSYLRKIRL